MAKFEEGNTQGQKFQAGEKQSEIARLGGIASGEKRRQKKDLKAALLELMEMNHKGKDGTYKTGYEATALTLYNKIMKGDLKAIKLAAELIDQYKQKVELGGGGQPFELKVVQTTPELQDKVNDYLHGGGPDGQGI